MDPVRTPRPVPEAGFALIEVIVSAVVLATIALAVLSGIDGAISTSVREKARAVATTLGEKDQERLRSMRAEVLASLAETRSVDVDGVGYTVESKGQWIRDATGGTQSCTNDEPEVDYLRITSTVTSDVVGVRTKPIKIDSIVSPPVAGTRGGLAVQVNDRDGVGLPGVSVSAVGPESGSDTTNELGCAIFTRVPVGTYQVTLDLADHVDERGNENPVATATVNNGTVKLVTMKYDRAGHVTVGAVTTTRPQDGATIASRATHVTAFNGGASSVLRRVFNSTLPVADKLFPFLTAYGFYTGQCAASDPGPAWFAAHPEASVIVDRGASETVSLQQPALNVRVARYRNGAYDFTYANGRTVTVSAELVVQDPNDTCADPQAFEIEAQGWLTRDNAGPYDPGLPFGTWRVCAEIGNNWWERRHAALDVTPVTAATPNPQVLDPWNGSSGSC